MSTPAKQQRANDAAMNSELAYVEMAEEKEARAILSDTDAALAATEGGQSS